MRRAQQKRETKQARRAAAFGLLALGTGAPLGAAVIVAPAADAATLSVTNLNDTGAGSLRAAVAAANAAAGADTISFTGAGATGVIQLTSGEIEVTDDVTISGPGSGQLTVDAGGLSRIFNIHPATELDTDAVVISGLTLTDGAAPSHVYYYDGNTYEVQEHGGAILASGYYAGAGSLSLDHVAITDSSAGAGGAVQTQGAMDLAVIGSMMSNNTATSRGGAVRSVLGTLQVTDSTLSGNTTGYQGGAIASGGSSTIEGSIISGNTAVRGGGLFLYAFYNNPSSVVRNTLISDNSAYYAGLYGGSGGGAVLVADSGTIALENATIVNNSTDGVGGGVRASGITMTSATIAGNSAGENGGGVFVTGPGTTLRNSIVANNSAATAASNDVSVADPFYDDPVALDFSLVESMPAAGETSTVTPGSNILGQDPQLGALADNGGPTQTMKPSGLSPVVDKGKSFGLAGDQRGSSRPVDVATVPNRAGGDGADLGAVELSNADVPVLGAVENSAVPTIGGTAAVGSTLSATSTGTWSQPGVDVSLQWLRNGAVIGGATGASYALGPADQGTRISLRVTASKSNYTTGTATSAQSGVVVPGTLVTSGTPAILGKLRVGKRLRAVPPLCTPAATISYQWLRSGKPIPNATKVKYKLKAADRRKKIKVRITLTSPGYDTKVVLVSRAGRVKG